MNIPFPRKTSLSFVNQKVPFVSVGFKKVIKKSGLKSLRRKFLGKTPIRNKKSSFIVNSVNCISKDTNFIHESTDKDHTLENNILNFPNFIDNSNIFSSEVLYDFSSEAYRRVKKDYEEKDKILQQTFKTTLNASNSHKKFPNIQNSLGCLVNNQEKRTFVISSSINTYIKNPRSPFNGLEIFEKENELLSTQKKVENFFFNNKEILFINFIKLFFLDSFYNRLSKVSKK